MSEPESMPDQGATELSNAPVSRAKPILRSKESGDQPRNDQPEGRDRPERGGNKERGKGKGRGRDRKGQAEEPQAKVNAALMRGPKPMPPKAAPEPVVAEETTEPDSTDETAESADEVLEVSGAAE